jgi:hypothetical protein
MLRAHGLVMNGGVLHAVECLSSDDRRDAEAAYRFYGFDDIASLLSRATAVFEARQRLEFHESELNRAYWKSVPDDGVLFERFQRHFAQSPTEYAPV